jgi:glycosyl transferase family 25
MNSIKKLENYVISLTSAHDRKAHIREQFNLKNIEFNFFDAVTPDNVEAVAWNLNFQIKNNILTVNELACFLSHFSLWNKIVNENISYMAIFEDDVYLSDSAEKFLYATDWIEGDIIKIEKVYKTVLLKNKKEKNIDGLKYFQGFLMKGHMGAGGYILSLNAAKKIIEYVKSLSEIDHVDQVLFGKYLKDGEYPIVQINPAICMQDCILNPNHQKFTTSLQWREKEKIKLKGLKRFLRELNRIFTQVFEFPYKTKLKFIVNQVIR